MIRYHSSINTKLKRFALLLFSFITPTAFSADTPPAAPLPQPTRYSAIIDMPYGTHQRQKLNFYQATSDKPTPVVFMIHGGGWVAGDKDQGGGRETRMLGFLINAGISVVAINYRYVQLAWDLKPPVKAPMEDAARALQFVRSKAKEWNIDKDRICVFGGSAGGCTALWLTFRDDMADPKSDDPVARESTRPWCAAVINAQTSLDPKQLKEWTPNSKYGGHAFGFMAPKDPAHTRDAHFAEFLEQRGELMPLIKEYSPYEWVTRGDPPVYLIYESAPAIGRDAVDPTHTSNFGVKLQERCKELGVECELVYPGAPDVKHQKIEQYIIEMLKAPAAK
jgi:acetyl esterase/lipase